MSTGADASQSPESEDDRYLVCQPVVMAAILIYSATSMIKISVDEALPTWAQTPVEDRGLGMTPAQTGVVMALNGGLMVLFQLTVFMYIRKCVSQMSMLQWASWLMVPGFVAIPLVAILGDAARSHANHDDL